MRVLHIAPISNNQTSGLSSSVYNLVEAQFRNKIKVGIILSKKANNFFSKGIKNYSIYNISFFRLIFNNPAIKILKDFGSPNAIIFHDLYNLRQSIIMIHLLRMKKKILITPRGAFSPIALSRSSLKKKIYFFLFIKPFLKNIYAFIALN